MHSTLLFFSDRWRSSWCQIPTSKIIVCFGQHNSIQFNYIYMHLDCFFFFSSYCCLLPFIKSALGLQINKKKMKRWKKKKKIKRNRESIDGWIRIHRFHLRHRKQQRGDKHFEWLYHISDMLAVYTYISAMVNISLCIYIVNYMVVCSCVFWINLPKSQTCHINCNKVE